MPHVCFTPASIFLCFLEFMLAKKHNSGWCLFYIAESVIRDMVGPDWKQRWLNWKNRTPEQVSFSLQW